MTYYYISGSTVIKSEDEPNVNDFVSLTPDGILRHYKNGNVVQKHKIESVNIDATAQNLARNMLLPSFRRRKSVKKSKVKRCKCK